MGKDVLKDGLTHEQVDELNHVFELGKYTDKREKLVLEDKEESNDEAPRRRRVGYSKDHK